MKQKPDKVFVVHGEDSVCDIFATHLKDVYKYNAYAPYSGAQLDLLTGDIIKEGIPIRVAPKSKQKRVAGVYARLVAAGQRLMAVIKRNEGGANKDLAKFASQIEALCDKWER